MYKLFTITAIALVLTACGVPTPEKDLRYGGPLSDNPAGVHDFPGRPAAK